MAERNGSAFRRVLLSADRLSDSAIFFGSVPVNTPTSRSRALLSLVTLSDHFLSDGEFDFVDILRTSDSAHGWYQVPFNMKANTVFYDTDNPALGELNCTRIFITGDQIRDEFFHVW